MEKIYQQVKLMQMFKDVQAIKVDAGFGTENTYM